MKRNTDDLYAVARKDFYAFVGKGFQIVNPDTDFLANWHIETMAWHLQMCAMGKIKRLIINIPPRHLKSITASVALPAWILGHDPSRNVVCVSYSNELATKHHRDFRTLVESRDYKRMFKNMRIDRRKNTELELATTKNGGRYATSVESTLTGRGGDIIIVDDPIKPDSAMSEADRN